MLKTERPVPHSTTANQRVERIAWSIMLMGFALFCLIVLGSGVLVSRYALRPSVGDVNVQVEQNLAVLVQRAGILRLEVFNGEPLDSGDRILVIDEAVPGHAATLSFGSATLQLWAGTDLLVGGFGQQWNDPAGATSRFILQRGQVAIDIAGGSETVEVGLGSSAKPVVLKQGRYRLRILDPNAKTTAAAERADMLSYEVAVERGSAMLGSLQIEPGVKLVEAANRQTRDLLQWNLLRDGDFRQLTDDATPQTPVSATPSPWKRNVEGTVEGAERTGQVRPTQDCVDPIKRLECQTPYLRLIRAGGNDKGFSTAIEQAIDADVSSYRRVVLHANAKIVDQSLSKAGDTGTECPLLVRVRYTSDAGQGLQQDYCYWAFEYPDRSGTVSSLPYIITEQLRPKEWVALELDLTRDLPGLLKIEDVSFQANGHDYESHVAEVRLTAEGLADPGTN